MTESGESKCEQSVVRAPAAASGSSRSPEQRRFAARRTECRSGSVWAAAKSQSTRQHGVSDKDAAVRRFLHREADQYHMNAEVAVTFSDFEKMERVCGVLLEKLDKSVCVGAPQFYHSAEYLSQMRRRACVSAVENAQQKACEVSQLLGQTLGAPLLVREEETREWRNEDGEDGGRLSHLPCTPTITMSSQVSVSFSLRDGSRKKL
ncbi:interleukin-1 receptor-associated kinase 1-binding protein 1 homolog isoform X2 [Chelmon rostratus]|uniref:interleukin-1 receptor-associated kinase 1-binding protein 1 homolog isoform X2 n=1 Tax=Chelmon rostratus TaxID=109905 RepID=UPI001BE6F1A4|nr:interleukin-1 receptor-associated kinase 1-binding protein 1 homolog isoform X2 [Chelmon rostratus]